MSPAPATPRTVPNRVLLVLHFLAYVLAPSIAAIGAVGDEGQLGWSPALGGVVRLALFFLVVPVYFVYMGISLGRFFPREPLRALLSFVPAGFTVFAVFSHGVPERAPLAVLRSGLPLFVGFMTLLILGLVVLVIRKSGGSFELAVVGLTGLLVAVGYGPVLYLAALHLALAARDGQGLQEALQFTTSVALVALFHLKPIRQLYREGAL